MADLTLKDIFGENVSYDSLAKTITFEIKDINVEGFDPNKVTARNCDKCASKILWALLNQVNEIQPSSNNDPERGVYIVNQGSRRVTRGNVSQFAFQLVVNGHTPDPMPRKLAADDLVAEEEANNSNG